MPKKEGGEQLAFIQCLLDAEPLVVCWKPKTESGEGSRGCTAQAGGWAPGAAGQASS